MRILLLFVLLLPALARADSKLPVERLQVPPGFTLSVFSDQVPNAREMALGSMGTVFVGSMTAGKVYALTDADHDGHAERVRVIARGLRMPVGVAFHAGDLYISANDRIVVLRDIERRLDTPPAPEVITDALPDKRHHGWRFIAFGPDGRLYVGVGAPCNVCAPAAPFASILSMRADGSDWRIEARGVRNTVGFDWQPGTGKLWFTDNGRDMLGDHQPDDELNRVDRPGQDFGFPHCHAGDITDPEFGAGHPCRRYTPPILKLGAHVAALGMRFYTGTQFPTAFRNAIFIAQHGSWNRSSKIGYRVMVARMKGDAVLDYRPFLTGFLHGQHAWGRPADVLVAADGSLLVSDDKAGAIYRIGYDKGASHAVAQ